MAMQAATEPSAACRHAADPQNPAEKTAQAASVVQPSAKSTHASSTRFSRRARRLRRPGPTLAFLLARVFAGDDAGMAAFVRKRPRETTLNVRS
jgi:hypothetical protein